MSSWTPPQLTFLKNPTYLNIYYNCTGANTSPQQKATLWTFSNNKLLIKTQTPSDQKLRTGRGLKLNLETLNSWLQTQSRRNPNHTKNRNAKEEKKVEIQRKSDRKAVIDTIIKLNEKRHRIKQVQVQEKIIHKKRLQYFIGRGAEVHYSPPLWQKCPSYLSVGQNCALKIELTSSCSDCTSLLRTLSRAMVPDRPGRSQVAGCNMLSLHPLQGLIGVEESPLSLWHQAHPLTAARGSPVPCHQNRHRCENENN